MNIVYTSKGTKVQGAYRGKHQLVAQPGAVFPDVCIGCGKPANRLDDDVRNTEPVKVCRESSAKRVPSVPRDLRLRQRRLK